MNPSAKPPVLRSSRRWLLPVAAAFFVVALVLFAFDPNQYGFYPRCVFKAQTGWDCPGCGGLRAAHQLLHGHVAQAFALNPFLIVVGPVLMVLLLAEILGSRTGWEIVSARRRAQCWVWLAVAMAAFGIVRNLSPSLWAMN